jgi:HEPN domain-containing protein
MTKKEHIEYWINSADNDLRASQNLFLSGNYDWSLFLAHLVLEKALKALYVSTIDDVPPKIHNLVRLAERSGIKFESEQLQYLDFVNSFNIEARYPDYKQEFYKIVTKEFAEENLNKIVEYYQWIRSRITYVE